MQSHIFEFTWGKSYCSSRTIKVILFKSFLFCLLLSYFYYYFIVDRLGGVMGSVLAMIVEALASLNQLRH